MIAVGREARTSTGCQWQSQRIWLEIWESVAGETSTSVDSAGGRVLVRARKLPRMVWRWPLVKKRRGVKSAACAACAAMFSTVVDI